MQHPELGFSDYGDFVSAICKRHGILAQDAFYLFEKCTQDTGFFDDCASYEEAINKVVESFTSVENIYAKD